MEGSCKEAHWAKERRVQMPSKPTTATRSSTP
jgi:hypothetical protein